MEKVANRIQRFWREQNNYAEEGMAQVQPIILAGGTGSRLWPLSRELYPKQLLNLTEEKSLLQATIQRVYGLAEILPPVLVIGEEHRFIAQSQIDELDLAGPPLPIILEPVGRNTAPAVCAAALYCLDRYDENNLLLVLPADHLIRRQQAFQEAVHEAAVLADQGFLVTFGIKPLTPETGYGYIEAGDDHRVLSFVEKPDQETAKRFVSQGNYYWNSGMFAFTAKTFIEEMKKHAPAIHTAMLDAIQNGQKDYSFFRLGKKSMAACPDDSIDYALMEKSDRVAVVPADMDWSDIGSWKALWEVSDQDKDGNVVQGDVILEDVQQSLIRSEHRLVTAVGLRDTLVVETADAVLVAPLSRAQDVKKIVNRIKARDRDEYRLHRTVYRPWGSYTVLEEQPRFQIKRLTVKPGVKLSLQMHYHRSEHWVVVRGTARVTCGEKTFLVHENQSTYISAGERHRLENPGNIDLELIEVQNGSYLGEDDIIRFDDDFGRET
jgi:mannose-1-phosphate guanylyltransferase/mannose-6-phosphate isomerase